MAAVPAIRKLLIANRGEIARRICLTATEMGIKTVAVHTGAESDAPHVRGADEAVLLDGSGPAAYLDIAAIIEAARASGADAVHPGYGFLAENAAFASAVIDADLAWVGPPAEAIARMGDKIEAKRIAREAGVPTLEHYGDAFPVLVKAAAGGGGKGMRIVRSAGELDEALAAARREAERSFGDGTVFIEPFVEKARHVEIQIIGDGHGDLIHLGERECSIQRRHQKIVEESPSVAVDKALRTKMGEAALSLAKQIGYRNAGTVEFLLDGDGRFFFMEMNTRLQVEHPVTEEITGVDLVEQQLLDAMGERITAEYSDPLGHAIEVRLNSEDPTNDYLPATGTLVGWAPDYELIRVESGVEVGSVVSTSFDPMLAKFIAHAPTRSEAALKLASALERSVIQGVQTNRDALVSILRSDPFVWGDTTTDFLERVHIEGRVQLSDDDRAAALAAAALDAEKSARGHARTLSTFPSGWRNSRMPAQKRIFSIDDEEVVAEYERDASGAVTVNGTDASLADGVVRVGKRTVPVQVNRVGDSAWVHGPWGDVEIVEKSPFPTSEIEEESGSLHAPMPGKVVSVNVKVGDEVKKGQTLVVIEAMKMEHAIGSPEDGVVSEVRVGYDEQVERGALLVVVRAPDID